MHILKGLKEKKYKIFKIYKTEKLFPLNSNGNIK